MSALVSTADQKRVTDTRRMARRMQARLKAFGGELSGANRSDDKKCDGGGCSLNRDTEMADR